ncbi:MAG: NAD(+)/NADH kinase [Verrucomicrobiota bacterium]
MKRIGVIANNDKPDVASALERLSIRTAARNLTLFAASPTADLLPHVERVACNADLSEQIEVLMALGGDGTMLHSVRELTRDIPMIGVNLGSLGFMTSVSQDELEAAVDALADESFQTSHRTAMDCTVIRKGERLQTYKALNDIVLGWGASSRIVTLSLRINEEEVSSYACDGLIVSTPTGSTGHSLSAGGPIVHPEARTLLINMLCAHTLSARPMVIPDDNVLTIEATEVPEDKHLILSIDGQSENPFHGDDVLEIRKNPLGLRLIHLPGYSYYSVLRQKLHWRGRNV